MYINTFNAAMRQRFGTKVYKLSLDGGFTCPNRDGTIGYGGCIFCSGDGSGTFAERHCDDIAQQIERAKARVSSKIKDGKYIAYFQSFTNTYATVDKLRTLFTKAIMQEDVVAISIATRPDCLEQEKIELLAELNKIKPVWVELGLQTVNEATARYIRRGYEPSVYDDAVQRLKNAGIEIIVHVILGLPNEVREDMYSTIKYVGDSGIDGIKLQLLHVLKGTDLCKDYEAGKFKALELDEYTDILIGCIERLPSNIIIHRMTGDGAKKDLVAPLWSGNKKMVLNTINKTLQDRNVVQGRLKI